MTRTNSGSLIRDPITSDPVAAVLELDLYDELSSFADLSAEQRQQSTAKMHSVQPRQNSPVREQSGQLSAPIQPGDASGGGFEVVAMSKTKPLVKRPLRSEEDPSMVAACPSCGASNACNDLFCDACGAFLA